MDSKTSCCGWAVGTAKGTSRNGFKYVMILKDSLLLAPIKTFHLFLKIYYRYPHNCHPRGCRKYRNPPSPSGRNSLDISWSRRRNNTTHLESQFKNNLGPSHEHRFSPGLDFYLQHKSRDGWKMRLWFQQCISLLISVPLKCFIDWDR